MRRLIPVLGRRDGNIAVEIALGAPIVLALLAGMIDYGRAVIDDTRLTAAVRAGLEYAQAQSGDTDGIVATVRNAAGDPGLSVTTASVCECVSGSGAACGSTCDDGNTPGTFVVVSAQQPFTPYFAGMTVVIESPLSAQGTIRIK